MFGLRLNYYFTLKTLSRIEILLLDNNYANLNLLKFKTKIFNQQEIYLKIFLKSLFIYFFGKTKKKLKEIYLNEFFLIIRPKIIIGHHYNNLIFKAKKYAPESKIVLYLHTRLYQSQFNYLKKKSQDTHIDYFFVCDGLHKKMLSKYYKSKFIINGLVKNNEIHLLKKKSKYDILYISEYRNVKYPKKKIHFKYIKYIAKVLNQYSIANQKKIAIALNSSRIDKNIPPKKEINFFKNIAPNLKSLVNTNSYEAGNISELIVCLNSNLGADLLARNKKVLFLPYLFNHGEEFKNPYFNKKIPFVLKSRNKKLIFDKIDYLLKLNKLDWEKKLKKSKIKIIFDEKNLILKKELYKIIKDQI